MALTLLAGSVVYNVWAFGNPRPRPQMESPPPLLGIPSGPSGPVAAPAPVAADPVYAARAEDLALDRNPVWLRNPFKGAVAPPREPVAAVETTPGEPEPEIVLNSILYSPMRKLAMVNGRAVRVGDRVGAARVLDIQPDAIVVELPSGGVRTIARRTARSGARP
jgi:hypothetical protein